MKVCESRRTDSGAGWQAALCSQLAASGAARIAQPASNGAVGPATAVHRCTVRRIKDCLSCTSICHCAAVPHGKAAVHVCRMMGHGRLSASRVQQQHATWYRRRALTGTLGKVSTGFLLTSFSRATCAQCSRLWFNSSSCVAASTAPLRRSKNLMLNSSSVFLRGRMGDHWVISCWDAKVQQAG